MEEVIISTKRNTAKEKNKENKKYPYKRINEKIIKRKIRG